MTWQARGSWLGCVALAMVWSTTASAAGPDAGDDELPASVPADVDDDDDDGVDRLHIAALLLRATDGDIEPELADSLTELILGILAATGRYTVVGKEEVKSLLGVADEMRALECIASAPCLGALAAHLSVEKALVGTVARVDDEYRLSISLVNLISGKTENNTFIRLRGDDTALSEHLASRVMELATPRPDPGRITVSSSVEGASVILDRVPVGTAPLERGGLAPGMHEVSVVKPGYLDWNTEVLVNPGRETVVEATLEADPSYGRRPGVRAATLVLGATAIVAAGTGVTLGVLAVAAKNDVESGELTQRDAVERARTAVRFRDAANGLYIGAGAVAVTSVVLMIVFGADVFGRGGSRGKKKKKKAAALRLDGPSLSLHPDGAAVGLRGSF